MIFRNLQTNPPPSKKKKNLFREVFQQPSSTPSLIEKDTNKISSNLFIIQKDVEKYLDLKAKCK